MNIQQMRLVVQAYERAKRDVGVSMSQSQLWEMGYDLSTDEALRNKVIHNTEYTALYDEECVEVYIDNLTFIVDLGTSEVEVE